jgi:hypothetical protein
MMLTFLNCDVVRPAALHGGRRNAWVNLEKNQMCATGYRMRLIESAAQGISGPVPVEHLVTGNDPSFDTRWN